MGAPSLFLREDEELDAAATALGGGGGGEGADILIVAASGGGEVRVGKMVGMPQRCLARLPMGVSPFWTVCRDK